MTTITGTSGADTIASPAGADVISTGAGDDRITWTNGGSDNVDGGDGFDTLSLSERGSGRVVQVSGFAGQTFVSDSPPDTGGPVVMVVGPPKPVAPANLAVSHVEELDVGIAPANSFSATDLVDSDLSLLRVGFARFTLDTSGGFLSLTAGTAAESISVTGSGLASTLVQESLGARTVLTQVSNLIHDDVIAVHGGAGDDVISAAQAFGRTAQSSGLELSGGGGNDFIDLGAFVTAGGDAGDDFFRWNANFGGHDSVDGGAGRDRLEFDTDFISQGAQLSSSGGHLVLNAIGADLGVNAASVEDVHIFSRTQGSTIIVGDLTNSGVQHVDVDLGPGQFGVNAPNSILTLGSEGNDSITFASTLSTFTVFGLPEGVSVNGAFQGDSISVIAGGGNDLINGAGIGGHGYHIDLIGGAGNDTIVGSPGNTRLLGGDGFDVLTGAGGFQTTFAFNAVNVGVDHITNFRVDGPEHDIIELDGFGLRYTNQFQNFVLHNMASDGHGGTQIFNDSGFLIVDVEGVAFNRFQQSDFLFG